MSNQPISLAIASAAAFVISKYIEENLQQIFQTILKVRAPTTSKEPWNKPLKAHSLNVYYRKSHIEYKNFCPQCEDYFAIAKARGANRILVIMSFLQSPINFCW